MVGAWRRSMIKYAIAHRGASDYAPENTLGAFRKASELGANMWELDVHLTKDGACAVCHDHLVDRMTNGSGAISDMTLEAVQAFQVRGGERIPAFTEVVQLAQELSAGLYVEVKGDGAGPAAIREMDAMGFDHAIVGSFRGDWIKALHDDGCRFPLSVLVPKGADPFEAAQKSKAQIIHLCWEGASARPQDLVTPELINRARDKGLGIVLWHEERPDILADILKLPVLGICSNRPEMLVSAIFQS